MAVILVFGCRRRQNWEMEAKLPCETNLHAEANSLNFVRGFKTVSPVNFVIFVSFLFNFIRLRSCIPPFGTVNSADSI